MMRTPIVAMLWQGVGVVAKIRKLCGPTDSKSRPEGTIRGDFGEDIQVNVVHASDSVETAKQEARILFGEGERFSY